MRSMIAAAAGALMAYACGGSPNAPSYGPVTIAGRTIDFSSGADVPSALVEIGVASARSDASGRYTLTIPAGQRYDAYVDGDWAGNVFVTGARYRGDLLVNPGKCVSRYGIAVDGATLAPAAGASVQYYGPASNAATVSAADGWYRLDLGCPSLGIVGFNTMFIRATHPTAGEDTEPVGRGIAGVSRLDLVLHQK